MDYDVVVIGAGASGLTSAMYASRSGLRTAVIERGIFGGQMMNTGDIENYSGFGKTTGAELSQHMYDQAIQQGVEYVYGDVEGITREQDLGRKFFAVLLKGKQQPIFAKSVIIATGVEHKHLDVDGEEELAGCGVSYCAICDGAFFRNKHVAVVGGGDSALEEANYLTGVVDKVTIIHRRDKFRGQKVLQDRVMNNPKISRIMDANVTSINGAENKVESVNIEWNNGDKGELHVDGIFIYVGLKPVTDAFQDLGIVNDSGYIETDDNMQTSIKGIFAVGDVREKHVRQIATAVGDGAIAGTQVKSYIDSLED